MLLPGRHGSASPGEYRYGFNGKEKDDELKGEGNGIDYEKRFYDPRIGRFLSIDPLEKKFPWYTPYQFAGNTPIQAIDLDGAEEYHYTLTLDKKGKTRFTLTNVKTHNHVTLLWGLIDRYYKIPVKRYVITNNNTKYYIGFQGTYGNGNQDKGEVFENIRDTQSMWSLSDFKGLFNSEAQSNYQSTVQTSINIQNNSAMYGSISQKAWYTKSDDAPDDVHTPIEEGSVTVTRVQTAHKDSQRITVDNAGDIHISGKTKLYITIDDENHVNYYYNKKGGSEGGASITTFQVKKEIADEIRRMAIPQAKAKTYPNLPEQADVTKSKSAYGLPANYIEKLQKGAVKGSATVTTP